MKKLFLFLVLCLMMIGIVNAATINVVPNELSVKTNAVASWDGSLAHLITTGSVGSGDEARIVIQANDVGVNNLNDLNSISWDVDVVTGYLPHVDIILDLNDNGVYDSGIDDALVFEYAKATVANCDNAPYPTGELTTFGDKGNIDDATYAWLTSADAGPCSSSLTFFWHSLADWKIGQTNQNGKDINGNTKVLRFELEVDNWIAQSEAYVDNININGVTYYGLIQDAIDSAFVGDTINVATGTYVEDLWIEGKDNLELVGNSATIKGATLVDDSLGYYAEEPNIMILSEGIKLHGFTIESKNSEVGKHPVQITLGGSNFELYDNTFNVAVGTPDFALALVSYCDASFCGLGPYNNNVDISGLNIHDNIFNSLTGTGNYQAIYLNPDIGTDLVTIKDNQFGEDLIRAIANERSNVLIQGNNINTNLNVADSWQGISLVNWWNSDISDVSITGNILDGFKRGLRLAHPDALGLLSNVEVISNEIKNSDFGIYVYKSADEVTINKNKLTNNAKAVQNDDISELNAQKNYWGTTVESEIQDLISDNVNYDPWYTDEDMGSIGSAPVDNGDGTQTVTLSSDTSLDLDTGVGTIHVSIPAGIKITGATGWTGEIQAPTLKATSSVSVTPTTGNVVSSVDSVIEVGFPNVKLVFDKAVRILIPGQAGKSAGYSVDGTDFTAITSVCADDTQLTNDLMPAESECKIDVVGDLVVWTKHFTSFVAYTQSAAPTSPSTGGSSDSRIGGGGAVSVQGTGLVGERLKLETPIIEETKEEEQPVVIEEKGNEITGAVIGSNKTRNTILVIGALVLVVIVGLWQGGSYIKGRKGIYF